MSEFRQFKKYNNPEEAGVLVEILKKNNIEYELTSDTPSSDVLFAGNTMTEEIQINIKEQDFETVTKLQEEINVITAETLEKDYYLFEFSDDELLDLLKNPDEWSLNDYHWAREILTIRGKDVDDGTIEKWQNDRLENLSQTETVSLKYLILAWFFCLMGGFIGIFMGRHLSSYKKLLPNGQKIYGFNQKDRKKGYQISIAGFIVLLIWIGILFWELM